MPTTPTELPTDPIVTPRVRTANDRGVILSTLWIAVMLNYLYCDILILMDAKLLKQYLTGNVNGLNITRGFLLGAGVLMQIPIWMIVLSRVLRVKPNRWANIAAGSFMTVIQFMSLLVTRPTMYYLFFSIIEIGITLFIVWYAWKWRVTEAGPTPDSLVSA